MALTILAGIACGIIGCIPFVFAAARSKKVDPRISSTYGLWFFFAIAVSFLLLLAGIAGADHLLEGAKDMLFAFVVAEVGSWLILVIIFGIVKSKRGSK